MEKILVSLKVLVLLMSVLLIFGCGSGGDTTISSDQGGEAPGGSPGDAIAPGMGRIVVEFAEGPIKAGIVAQALSAGFGRVVVSKFGETTALDEDGNPVTYFTLIHKQIADVSIPGTAAMQVPADTGYQIDVITYAKVGSLNVAIKTGNKAGVSVTQGIDNNVSISLSAIAATLNIPTLIESGITYSLLNANASPIRNDIGYVRHSFSPITADTFTFNDPSTFIAGTVSPANKFQAPPSSTIPSTDLYLQGQFFIDTSLLKDTELKQWYNWTYYSPISSIKITPPTQVKIIINP